MSAHNYLGMVQWILAEIQSREMTTIRAAAKLMAAAIRKKGRVYMFGSGHSVIPVLDIFPRYGSFVGFFPLYDPRLMWSNVIGPGGARELLWLERQEGYAKVFLQSYPLEKRDVMLVFSHGGLNAAGIDMALEARARGLKVVTVSSHANAKIGKRSHSSGKILAELADVAIDNHVPPEDALVDVGQLERVAAGSTVAAVSIAMSLVAETAAVLAKTGKVPPTFVSPNVRGVPPGHMAGVYQAFTEFYYARPFKAGKKTARSPERPSDRGRIRPSRSPRSRPAAGLGLGGHLRLRHRHGHPGRHPALAFRAHRLRRGRGRQSLPDDELRHARHVALFRPSRRPLRLQGVAGRLGLARRRRLPAPVPGDELRLSSSARRSFSALAAEGSTAGPTP